MKVTLKEFRELLLNNKSQFAGSLGFNSNIEKAKELINKHGDKIKRVYDSQFKANGSSYNLKREYYKNKELHISNLSLNGSVELYNDYYILQCNGGSIMLYLIDYKKVA